MKRLGIFFVTLFALCLFAIPASAGTTDDVAVSFTVLDIYDILITDGTWTPTVGYTQIDAGEVVALAEESLLYKANHVFDITMYRTDGANWVDAWTLAVKDDTQQLTYKTVPEDIGNKVDYCTAVAAGEATWSMDWKLSGLTFANTPAAAYSTTVTFTIEAG